jgi:hypothetical protein
VLLLMLVNAVLPAAGVGFTCTVASAACFLRALRRAECHQWRAAGLRLSKPRSRFLAQTANPRDFVSGKGRNARCSRDQMPVMKFANGRAGS